MESCWRSGGLRNDHDKRMMSLGLLQASMVGLMKAILQHLAILMSVTACFAFGGSSGSLPSTVWLCFAFSEAACLYQNWLLMVLSVG